MRPADRSSKELPKAEPATAVSASVDRRHWNRPTKVQACHLDRLAVVYVRQSSPFQARTTKNLRRFSAAYASVPSSGAGRRNARWSSKTTRPKAESRRQRGSGSNGFGLKSISIISASFWGLRWTAWPALARIGTI